MNKICLITGASSGIGLEAAKQIAVKGYDLILINRSKIKAEEAKKQILAVYPNCNIQLYEANLASTKEIKQVAEKIKLNNQKIDVLINNAGAVYSDFEKSEDGVEMTMANNHLSYYSLTLLLLPLLLKSNEPRVVNVASTSHFSGKFDLDSFTSEKNYFILKAYAQSKLCNVMFTKYLAEKLSNTSITVNTLCPGRVRTDIGNKSKGILHRIGWTLWGKLTGISVQKGAQTHVYLATHPDALKYSGSYFKSCKERNSKAISYDKNLQKQLWDWSEKMTGIKIGL